MSKCGKGCLPECEYFTTGGCISPFNCMYKEESGYINSATSGTVIYTGGMNMTNEEMIENLKCVIADISEQCEQLKAENAALRTELEDYKIEERRAERISKYKREDARRVADKIARCCLAHCGHKVRIEAQDGFWIETCTYPPYHGKWIVEIEKCPKAEEAQKSAEARLAELKGEEK